MQATVSSRDDARRAGRVLPRWFRLALRRSLVAAVLLGWGALAAAAEALPAGVFATVNSQVISGDRYLATLRGRARQKFYHGQIPEAELRAFREEVGEFLVRDALLIQEAARRGVSANEEAVARQLDRIEQRYANSPQWAKHRERILAELGRRLRSESKAKALEARVRDVPAPSEAEVRGYYKSHPDKFTTPEQVSVSVILLRVPPSSPPAQWERTRGEIDRISARLKQGEDFAALAHLVSQDPSAEEGGDLGFLHRDMLGDSAQVAIDRLTAGAVTAPVQLLEGFALFRLNARQPARLNPFTKVRERAAALLLRQNQDEAWRAFSETLRKTATVIIDRRYYQPSAQELAAQQAGRTRSQRAEASR